jgi:hypothetical protein
VTFVDLQLLGSAELPDPPAGPDVVDDRPQPTNASASAAEPTSIAPRLCLEPRLLKLLSVLTIGFREFSKIGSGEEVRKALCELYASLCWI